MIKVKHLHLQLAENFPEQDLPGLVYFLKLCDGIETLVLDLANMPAHPKAFERVLKVL